MKNLIISFILLIPSMVWSQANFQEVYSQATGEDSNSSNQYRLGNMYQAGWGVDVDIAEAIKWYKVSAENGNENAMYSLGLIFERGLIDAKENYEAIDKEYTEKTLYPTVANSYMSYGINNTFRSMSENLFNYGILIDQRFESTKPNYSEAIKWYKMATRESKKILGPRFRLGIMYYYGLGVEKNYAAAFNFFKEEHKIARPAIRSYLTVTKPLNDSRPFVNFLIDSIVTYNLGMMYFNGHGVEQNYKEALDFFRQSSRISNPDTQINFSPGLYQAGKMYYHGMGTKKNYRQAIKYLTKAAAIPNENTSTNFIIPGVVITKDKNIILYGEKRKSTANAMVLLAHIYRNGYGVKKNAENDNQALGWNYYAALSGHTQSIAALNTLGRKVPIRSNVSYNDYDDVFGINSSIPETFSSNYTQFKRTELAPLFTDIETTVFNSEVELISTLENAKSGDIASQLKLAEYYSNTDNVRKSDVTAYAWLTIAADNGSLEAIKYRNVYQERLSESQKLMAFEFARNVILSDNKKSKRKYEISERDRIEEEKKIVLAQLRIQKDAAINLVEREFEVKKEEEIKKIEDAAIEREQQAKKISQENIATEDDGSDDLEKELNKIENLYKKSLITTEERQLMRGKALGLN